MAVDRKHVRALTRDLVLAEALRLLDEEGIAHFSMRKLGRAVGVEAMSLYHHLPDKAAVLDGVTELVYAAIELPELPPDTPWHDELLALGWAFRDALIQHPGALPAVSTRFAGGPAALRLGDRLLAALRRGGLSAKEATYASNALGCYVIGFALAMVGVARGHPQTLTEEQWRAQFAHVTEDEHPAYAATLREAPPQLWSWDELFDVGLRALVDGLCVRVSSR